MTNFEYITTLDVELEGRILATEEEPIVTSVLDSLSNAELQELCKNIRNKELLARCKALLDTEIRKDPFVYYTLDNYTPYRTKNESFDCLLDWIKERVKGKVGYAKKILIPHFDGFSYIQQVRLLKVLLFQAPSDRALAYKKLFSCWDTELENDVIECWKTYHDDNCAQLITRLLPVEFIKENIKELAVPRNYYNLCRRVGNESWFVPEKELFAPDITIRYYLEAMSYTLHPISYSEAREQLYRIVSVFIYGIQTNKSGMGRYGEIRELESGGLATMPYYFDDYGCDFTRLPDMGRIFACLCKMGLVDVVKEFVEWNNSVADYYTRLTSIFAYERNYPRHAKIIDVLSVAWYLFPKDLTFLLDYDSFRENTWINSTWHVLLHCIPRKSDKGEVFRIEDKLRRLTEDNFGEIPLREKPGRIKEDLPQNNLEQNLSSEEKQRLIQANPSLHLGDDGINASLRFDSVILGEI